MDDTNLRKDNPYSIGWLWQFPEGDLLMERDEAVFVRSNKDRYYTVRQGDDLWKIAFFAYGNSKLWWYIRDANIDQGLDFGLDLPIGITLLIPDQNTTEVANG